MIRWKLAISIAAARIGLLLVGWLLSSRYGDWRQLVGYPLLLVGALPDAALVRYVVAPTSRYWPIAMSIALVASSGLAVSLFTRARR